MPTLCTHIWPWHSDSGPLQPAVSSDYLHLHQRWRFQASKGKSQSDHTQSFLVAPAGDTIQAPRAIEAMLTYLYVLLCYG